MQCTVLNASLTRNDALTHPIIRLSGFNSQRLHHRSIDNLGPQSQIGPSCEWQMLTQKFWVGKRPPGNKMQNLVVPQKLTDAQYILSKVPQNEKNITIPTTRCTL